MHDSGPIPGVTGHDGQQEDEEDTDEWRSHSVQIFAARRYEPTTPA